MLWFRSPLLRPSRLCSPWVHSPIYSTAKRDPLFTYWCTHNIAMSCSSLPLHPDSPWDPNYPIAKNQTPSTISRDQVLTMLRQGQKPGKDFLLIDLRQADHTVRDPKLRIFDGAIANCISHRAELFADQSTCPHRACIQLFLRSIHCLQVRISNASYGTAVRTTLAVEVKQLTLSRLLTTSGTPCCRLDGRLHQRARQ